MFVKIDHILYIVFELTLFFLLFIILGNLFKKMVLPALHGYIEKIKKEWEHLKTKRFLLKKLKSKVKSDIEKQTITFDVVEKKITQWHQSMLDNEKNGILEKKKLVKKLLEKKEFQKRQLHIIKLQQEVIPKAAKLAHQELQKKFSDKKGAILLDKLMLRLKEQL